MRTFSTCRDCGDTLEVEEFRQTVHRKCRAKPTRVEQLAKRYKDAAVVGDEELMTIVEGEIEALDSAPPRLGKSALRYASWGWPVFPLRSVGAPCDGRDEKCARLELCQCPKKPATRNGFKDATTDATRIAAWWERHPRSNVGLATGFAFDVIDVDVPVGIPSFEALEAAGFVSDVHGRVTTASGGFHLYTLPTGKGNKAGMVPGVDYRGVGGYVVAPPSWLGVRGRAWSWSVHPSPEITQKGQNT